MQGAIHSLNNKISQNLKSEQFKENNTFLVLNLSMIHALWTKPRELRPVACIDSVSIISGLFWMVAFAQIGMPVFGYPNPPQPSIECITKVQGILVQYPEIAGMLILMNDPSIEPELWGLFRSNQPEDEMKILRELVKYRYNDELDSRGFCLNKYNDDFAVCRKASQNN